MNNPETKDFNEELNIQEETNLALNELSNEILERDTNNELSNSSQNQVEAIKSSETFTVTTEDLKGGPFDIDNHMIPLTYGNLLGEGQASSILAINNMKGKTKDSLLGRDTEINIPLIYPELKSEFPSSWNEFVNKKGFEKYKNSKSENHIVVTKCSNGMNALAYYKNGELRMATYVSIGLKTNKTVTGEYPVGDKIMKKRSKKYNDSPMPYSIHIIEGYFLHQGASNGKPRSHGCVRMPGLYERWLYFEMDGETKENTSIILDKLY